MSVVSNVEVYGLEESIKAAKYPFAVDTEKCTSELTPGIKRLAQSLKGEGHDQWLTGVTVQFDLTCSNKMWVEAERYRFLFFIGSESTIHRIAKFNLDKQYNEYVDPEIIEIMKRKVSEYNQMVNELDSREDLTVEQRAEANEEVKKKYLQILYSNPAGFTLTARMTTNYRQLKTIYAQRKNHKLPEWREFCKWIETLPMAKELIIGLEN